MSTDLDDRALLAARAPGYELAFEEAGRALDAQDRILGELRSSAGVLMAAAAITTSFFGGRAVTGDRLGTEGWIAIVAFALIALGVLVVLWPSHEWKTVASSADVIADVETAASSVPLLHRNLALYRAESRISNAVRLRRLFQVLRSALLILVIEVLAWLVALAGRA